MSTAPAADRWRGVQTGAMLIGVAVMAAIYAPQPLLAEIAGHFGRTAFEANLVVSMTTLGIALGVFPASFIATRVGRGRVLAVSLAGGAALTVVTALGDGWALLVASRVAVGLVMSGVLVSAIVWAGGAVAGHRRARVATAYVSGTTAGGMLGRLLAGFVTEFTDWRAGILAVDVAVIAGGAIGVALVGMRARQKSAAPTAKPADPSPYAARRIVRVSLFAVGFFAMCAFIGVFNATAFRMLEPPFSYGVAVTSMLFLAYISGTFTSMRAGVILERLGARRAILVGSALMIAGQLLTLPDSIVAIVAGLLLLAAGFFLAHAVASAVVPAVSPKPVVGSAWYTLTYYAGSSVSALALGWGWDEGRWPLVIAMAAAFGVLTAAVAFGIPARLGRR
ncbi:MFS transporter [Microbacterium gubbeenense]|uniref:MFS transporter n=1 Tax=Microbacterium gubbeenense TaxID=159896 RepID=UPI0003F88DDA|nr:MFS transporter [Microbacterium gubbeenense]